MIAKLGEQAVTSPIRHMVFARYYRDGKPSESHEINSPSWDQVEAAIRRMDNYCFPMVQLNSTDDDTNEGIFNIIGGAGRYALFQYMGEWQFEDSNGSDAEARLWDSDQGYFCLERNILTDIEHVVRIARSYYESGYYELLDEVQ